MRVTRLSRAIRSSKLRENPITIYTDSVTPDVFDPSWVFSDASLMTVDWGDGTPIEFNATGLNHIYAVAGRKTVKFTCPDWGKLGDFRVDVDVCRLAVPSFIKCTGLIILVIAGNQFTGTLPIFNNVLQYLYSSLNQISGYIPGTFAIQKDLVVLDLFTNSLPEASIDAILADLVTSLAIPGRAVCSLMIHGGTNAPPSNPAGLADKATLVAAGWTVVTN